MEDLLIQSYLSGKEKMKPMIAPSAFIAENAVIQGNVIIEENASIWYGCVIRSEKAKVIVSKNSNVQDLCVIHTDEGFDTIIREGVSIGHRAIIHGAQIGENTLVGMGAILMNGAVIGKNCIIGAGSVITENTKIPDDSLVVGIPGKVIKKVSHEQILGNEKNALMYVEEGQEYKKNQTKNQPKLL